MIGQTIVFGCLTSNNGGMTITQTDPSRRKYAVAALVGLIGGIISAIVKFGWEVPLPPRTPERNATNPPQAPAIADNFCKKSASGARENSRDNTA